MKRVWFIAILIIFYITKNFASELILSSNCGNLHNVFPDKNDRKKHYIEFYHKYGSEKKVEIELLSPNEEILEKYDAEFINKYGVMIFHSQMHARKPHNLRVLKLLLSKGVHPYDTLSGKGSILFFTILYEDRELFDLLRGEVNILSCKEGFQDLLVAAERVEDKYFLNALENIKKK